MEADVGPSSGAPRPEGHASTPRFRRILPLTYRGHLSKIVRNTSQTRASCLREETELMRGCRCPYWGLRLAGAWGLLGVAILLATGCTRLHYRSAADRQVYGIEEERQFDPRWRLPDR